MRTNTNTKSRTYNSSDNVFAFLRGNQNMPAPLAAKMLGLRAKTIYSYRYRLKKLEAGGPLDPRDERRLRIMRNTPVEETTPVDVKMVHEPDHYTHGGIETIDYIRAKLTPEQFVGYCRGNALKYLSRAGLKGDATEDLAKAQVYLGYLTESEG